MDSIKTSLTFSKTQFKYFYIVIFSDSKFIDNEKDEDKRNTIVKINCLKSLSSREFHYIAIGTNKS